jgi:hypothetical protein
LNPNGEHELGTWNKALGTMSVLVFAAVLLGAAGPMRTETAVDTPFPVTTFESPRVAEAVARLTVRCDGCAWDVEGREGATLALTLDSRSPIHLPIVRGGSADYQVLLGSVEPGSHAVRIEIDAALTAREVRPPGAIEIQKVSVEQYAETDPDYVARSLAPIVYARPDTVGRFTDVPLVMWYEVEPAGIATRYRYSVVFTNEDGGTPTDRLMATWGRTTDIEYLYSVVVDATGKILADDYQGADHVTTPFRGQREGRHPLLWVSTDNNMVSDAGNTRVRYAPAVQFFPLRNVSREAVMDANPWLYEVMARELVREGKIVSDAPPGKDTISDPRRFVYIEACGEVGTSALAFAVRVHNEWIPSDRGLREYRILRDGCFRAAVPLPGSAVEHDIRAVRAQAFSRPPRDGKPAPAPTPVELTRINRVFMLDDAYRPRRPLELTWQGRKTLQPDGDPAEFARR